MSLNNTPSGERLHIGFFGRRNAGKSSLVNAVTGQKLAVVSDVAGTTTDPVYKAMELLPIGPVMIMDTPGLDDEGELGALRIKKTHQIINKTDLAVLVIDGTRGIGRCEEELLALLQKKQIPCLIAVNKGDQMTGDLSGSIGAGSFFHEGAEMLTVSAETGLNVEMLREMLGRLGTREEPERPIVSDLLRPGDLAVLVVPVDKAAPKGRLILPQQQTIRDILDGGASALVTQDDGLEGLLSQLGKKPALVITDSQVFGKVSGIVPEDIPLTSFSILFARYKGDLELTVSGAAAADRLREGDRVLIAEGCTHRRQCGDIGTEKLPKWLENHGGCGLSFQFSSGTEFPEELGDFSLIVHCGGCMLNRREMQYRLACAQDVGVPITNYGMLIAHMNGILPRSMKPLGYGE